MKRILKAELAKTLYLLTDKSQKEICEIACCAEKTFTNWKQKGNWRELRDMQVMTNQQVINKLKGQLILITKTSNDEKRIMTTGEIDAISKLTSSIIKLEHKATLDTYIEVFMEYTYWLLTQNVEFAQKNNLYQDKFIQMKIKS